VSDFWKRDARAMINVNGWKPKICIQGGGAKGAWEAGVLAGLIDSDEIEPTAMFGTSAGALNALWASTAPVSTFSEHMLGRWLELSRQVMLVAIFCGGLFSLAVFLTRKLVCPSWFGAIGCAVILPLLVILILAGMVRLRLIKRIPGILPIQWAARLLPMVQADARWHCYFCTADVALKEPPHAGDWGRKATFQIVPGERKAGLVQCDEQYENCSWDARVAAMTSAALPGLFRSLRVGNRHFLDGGLEANLPAAYVVSNGALGGNCIICIVPTPVKLLNPKNHVDFRVLHLLDRIEAEQKCGRADPTANIVGMSVLCPALVISPEVKLRSGLLCGFFRPKLLRAEFDAGRLAGLDARKAMRSFQEGNNYALDSHLLEKICRPRHDKYIPPGSGLWALWMNGNWPLKL